MKIFKFPSIFEFRQVLTVFKRFDEKNDTIDESDDKVFVDVLFSRKIAWKSSKTWNWIRKWKESRELLFFTCISTIFGFSLQKIELHSLQFLKINNPYFPGIRRSKNWLARLIHNEVINHAFIKNDAGFWYQWRNWQSKYVLGKEIPSDDWTTFK